MSLCTEWTLGKHLPAKRSFKVLTCRSWGCDHCAPKRRRQLIQQAADGEPNRLLTLTISPHAAASLEERHDLLVHAWQVIVKRLRRRPKLRDLQYLLVKEATVVGEPHLHILLRCGFVPQSLLVQWMRELTGSYIVDIRRVRGAREAAAYVAKYIAKAPARFGASKRYIASAGYEVDKLAKQEADPNRQGKWILLRRSIRQIIVEQGLDGWIELDDGDDLVHFVPEWTLGP